MTASSPNPAITILDTLPDGDTFYGQYWNRRPFLVRGGIEQQILGNLITADELASLAMDQDARCRMIANRGEPREWLCRFGPFNEEDFAAAGDKNWSLMIQNVEQFHPGTATLLPVFSFAPRWLMDDVMVSFSAPDGTVGPHLDNYHVFLVQGQGSRRWTVGREPIQDETLIQGHDLRILENGFEGDEVETHPGDVLYVPPRFGHEGVTIESAMTYSVGFLGPKLSELFSAYSQYLSEQEDRDSRYTGLGLDAASAGYRIGGNAVDDLRGMLGNALTSPDFTQWLVEFFTESSHQDFADYAEREEPLTLEAFESCLKQGAKLIKPAYVKLALTGTSSDTLHLGVDNHSFTLTNDLHPLVHSIRNEEPISMETNPSILGHSPSLGFLLELFNHQALEFLDKPDPEND